MSDKITLDRQTFKVLAADTRIDMMKRLKPADEKPPLDHSANTTAFWCTHHAFIIYD